MDSFGPVVCGLLDIRLITGEGLVFESEVKRFSLILSLVSVRMRSGAEMAAGGAMKSVIAECALLRLVA